MININDCRKIAYVYKTHGVEGEVLISSEIEEIQEVIEKGHLFIDIDGYLVPFFIEEYRFKNNKSLITKFFEIDSLDTAEQLLDKNIFTDFKEEPKIESISEFSDLIGFNISDLSSGNNGEIIDLIDFSGNINFIIRKDKKEFIIPANEDFIESIDQENKNIVMKLPEGIFDIN